MNTPAIHYAGRKLTGLVDEMLVQCKEEFDAGNDHGTMSAKGCEGFPSIQAHGRRNWPAFEEAATAALVRALP